MGNFKWKRHVVLGVVTCVLVLGFVPVLAKKIEAVRWQVEELQLLNKIAHVLDTRKDEPELWHFKLERIESYKDLQTGKSIRAPLPSQVEGWVDEAQLIYRIEHNPQVARGVGLQPFRGGNYFEICDGHRTWGFYDWSDISKYEGNVLVKSSEPTTKLWFLLGWVEPKKFIDFFNGTRQSKFSRFGENYTEVSEVGWNERKIWRLFSENVGDSNPPVIVKWTDEYRIDPEAKGMILYYQYTTTQKNGWPRNLTWEALEVAKTEDGTVYPRKFRKTELVNGGGFNPQEEERTTETTITLLERIKSLPKGVTDLPPRLQGRFVANGATVLRERLELSVVNAVNAQPVGAVPIKMRVNKKEEQVFTTDGAGKVVIPLPKEEIFELVLIADHHEFARQRIAWQQQQGKRFQLPESYQVKLQPGVTISGRVVDEESAGLEGATVHLEHRRVENWGVFDDEMDGMVKGIEVKTDVQGRWELARFPQDVRGLRLWVRHDNYGRNMDHAEDFRIVSGMDYGSLTDGSCVIRLSGGDERSRVQGRVVDGEGKPVAGCRVSYGNSRLLPDFYSRTTNGEGGFRLANIAKSPFLITVESPNHKPFLIPMTLPVTEPLVVKVEPGKTLRGRVLKEDGAPSVGLKVEAFIWKEKQTLLFSTTTDGAGCFGWHGAPDEMVYFNFGVGQNRRREGLLQKGLVAGDQEQIIMLKPAIHLRAQVLDAITGAPISSFLITWANVRSGQKPHWRPENQELFENGNLDWASSYLDMNRTMLIEAEGYEPTQTEIFIANQQDYDRTYKLKPKR